MEHFRRIKQSLTKIYGKEKGETAFQKIYPLMQRFKTQDKDHSEFLSEKDIFLISYGDSLKSSHQPPLQTLHAFARTYLKDVVAFIHILPFFPYSSDDGFSVTDYSSIRHDLGKWEDIQAIATDFRLMFDLVINHVSARSDWFQRYLAARNGYRHLALEIDPALDLGQVVRPRSLPLLTRFTKDSGESVYLWTTFSSDQIDLNFKDPDVLALMVETLLLYVEKGASVIRLDAIAYLWKEIGTSCIHLNQTHEMVKLLRLILDRVAPQTLLITETNVPHEENISYFGNGSDEAQMVYNFTLPPLVLYSFVNEDATRLSEWADGLNDLPGGNAFFNFTASHDGIGVRPLEGILPSGAVDRLVDAVKENNGAVSYKKNVDGSQSPYELNISYVDAMRSKGCDGNSLHAAKFLASQALQFVFPGVPACYIHSLLGSRNWLEGVKRTGRARSINRESLDVPRVLRQLNDPASFRSRIFYPYLEMMKTRRLQRAFHPNASFEVLDLDSRIFAIRRMAENQQVYALTNVSSDKVSVSLADMSDSVKLRDLVSGKEYPHNPLQLHPYQYLWLCEA